MMNFIMVPVIVGIVFAFIYGVFELFVRRKERLNLIEKLGTDCTRLENLSMPSCHFINFNSLVAGCLMTGIGLGLLIGFFLNVSITTPGYNSELPGVIYGASVLLGGGAGMLTAFLIEMRMRRK